MNCVSLLLRDHILRICSVAFENSSEIQQLRPECEHLTLQCRNLATRTLASAARSLEAHVAQIPQLRVMIEVERQTSNTLQAEVLRLGAEHLQICQKWERSKEEVAQLQARCNEFGHLLEPTQSTRDEGYFSPELELMQMEENEPGSAATGCVRMGTDETTLIDRVEPSPFVVAGDRLPVHPSSSKITACLSDTLPSTQSSGVLAEEPEQVERDTASQKRDAE